MGLTNNNKDCESLEGNAHPCASHIRGVTDNEHLEDAYGRCITEVRMRVLYRGDVSDSMGINYRFREVFSLNPKSKTKAIVPA